MQPDPTAVNASLSEMFDALEDAVSVIDRDLRVAYVNDAFCSLVGWPRPVLLGAEPPMPWWSPDEADRAVTLLRRLMDGGEIAEPSEERVYRHRTGRPVPVTIRSSLLRDDAGEVTALVAFTRPVGGGATPTPGDALRAERERLARTEQSLRAAGESSASLARALAAPLGRLQEAVRALGDDGPGVRAVADAAGEIDRIARELSAVWEAGSGEEAVEPGVVDLVPLSLTVLADLGHDADRRGLRLRGDLVPEARVRGDRDRLRQVLEGLVGDALRRAPQGSEVRLGLRCGGGWAVVEADDRGPGLDEDEREALFAPGGRGAGEHGIGLAVARSVARAHGGELDAQDVLAGGRSLRLTLPLADDGP